MEALRRFDGKLPMTVREAYRVDSGHSWLEFMDIMNQLVSNGYLLGQGDGFDMRYTLTKKGRNALGVSST